MMNRILLFLMLIGLLSCSNLDTVAPSKRDSFIHYYGGTANYTASDVIEVSDGFVLLGDSVDAKGNAIIIIKTDNFGRTVWRKKIESASSSNIKAMGKGYLIIGDSMKIDPTQNLVIDQVVRKMRLISLDSIGSIIADLSWGKLDLDNANRTDVRGSAVTFDQSGGIVSTSTINRPKVASVFQSAQVSLHDPVTLQIQWSQIYDQDQKDYQNSKSVHFDGTNIVWAASAVLSSANSARSFVRIPVFQDNGTYSTFVNGGLFGENETNAYYSGRDIQPNGVGYGIIGTTRTFTGDASNLFFLRTLTDGTPIDGSDLYIDGPSLAKDKKPLTDNTISLSQDEGLVLSPSTDGGFLLLGTTTSTADGLWGNGGKDIFLIKLSPFNDVLWYKTFGGTGDEIPTSVKQTTDGGYLISGTLTLSGQSSIFLIKTDENGEIKN